MRLSEQYGLKWSAIDWEIKSATIPLSKSGKVRRVPLSDEVLTILRAQFSESPYVFPRPSDPIRQADTKEISKRFGERLTKAGIAGGSWHVCVIPLHRDSSRQERISSP